MESYVTVELSVICVFNSVYDAASSGCPSPDFTWGMAYCVVTFA